jgi:gamma-tubulin complex component 3
MFEVLECSWSDLLNKLSEAKDLEQILEAHDDSLLKILTRLHLDGHETSQELAKQLRCIFDLILNFGTIIQRLIQSVDNELQARKPYQQQHHGTYTKNNESVIERKFPIERESFCFLFYRMRKFEDFIRYLNRN